MSYFDRFRSNIIGIDQTFATPYGEKRILYADWIASGRLYRPIEEQLIEEFGPFVGNTHSESSITGTVMTAAYHEAHRIIKDHVHAGPDDILINAGSGMTGVTNKLIRILGLRVPEQLKDFFHLPEELRPVVFITHMEHHSNQTNWLETLADVVVLEPGTDGLTDPAKLEEQLGQYRNRQLKIGSFSACSNVTGIRNPVHALARIMHENGGYCFADYACSAPYDPISMHTGNALEKLDAIFFSPHKFLGGPGTPGILVFDSKLYKNKVPDDPGGGTVDWTNPWGQHRFVNSIEAREDGGTPPFLQTIKAALAIRLKEDMGTVAIHQRESELVNLFFTVSASIPRLNILAGHIRERLGAISFYLEGIHYNLIVKLLNDRYGIQARGGCSCAGTYGHYLLHVDQQHSQSITRKIDTGDLSEKPGWVRISLHPTMHEGEVLYIANAISEIEANANVWANDYCYNAHANEFRHISGSGEHALTERLFKLS